MILNDKMRIKKKLYIDIDGVLLHTKNVRVAEYAEEFIDYITTHFDCYWLTTHCKGDAATAIQYLSQYLPPNILGKIRCIQPTDWGALKTDAINFNDDFYWLDDYPFRAEVNVLKQHACEDRCIVVNLNREGELKRIMLNLSFLR